MLGRLGCQEGECHEDIHLALDQFGGEGGEPLGFLIRRAGFNDQVLTLDPAERTQLVAKGFSEGYLEISSGCAITEA